MIDSLEIVKRSEAIHDSGPMYNEFVHNALIHEPWNAYSSLCFFIPIIYWIIKLRGEYRQHLIIVILLPLLFLNGLGSTLFHAFRTSELLFLLDVIPASLMSFTLSIYFWTKMMKTWYVGVLCVIAFYITGILTMYSLSFYPDLSKLGPNIGYFFVGCSLFIPILIDLFQRKFKFWKEIFFTVIFLVLALLCRVLDYPSPNLFESFLPQGTHFLWHIFSSLAVFSLGLYLYRSKKELEGKMASEKK